MASKNNSPVLNPIPVILLIIFCLLISFLACRHSLFDKEDVSEQLSGMMKPVDTGSTRFKKQKLMTTAEATRYVYQQNRYMPLWISEKGISGAVKELIDELETLQWDGLDPAWYSLSELRTRSEKLSSQKRPALHELLSFDTLCTHAYLHASRDLLLGRLTPRMADSLWYNSNDSVWQAAGSLASGLGAGNYPPLSGYRSKIRTYALLQQILQQYSTPESSASGDGQTAQQSDSLSRIIRANLERLRWLPQRWEEQYILVNIPQMELKLLDNGKDVMRMRVIVGRPSRQTPALSKPLTSIVFNPSWGVPPTILKKDVLPGLNRSGEAYLKKKNLRAYDRNGNPVDAGSIDESNYKEFVYRQPPGDDNSLGLIKFNMPNVWNIYLHDTPNKSDFAQDQRDKSSGCIRVEYPRELTEYILVNLNGKKEFSRPVIDSLVTTHKTLYESLERKLPVHLVYLTAFEDNDQENIRFIPDIYNRDGQLIHALIRQDRIKD